MTALVTTAIVMSRVGGDLGDDDTDVVAVSELRNGVPKVLTISVDVPPPTPVESFNMASACGGVVFGSPTRFGISIIDSLPCRNLLRPSFHGDKLTPRSGQTYSASSCSRNKPTPRHLKLTPPVFNEAEWLPHLRHPRMLCSVARRRGGSGTLDLRARSVTEWSKNLVTG